MEKISRKEETLMSDTYFSQQNIDIIQTEIYLNVLKKQGYKIDKQPVNDILIIMRGIYNLYGNPYTERGKIKSEIIKLNKIFVEMTTNMIISNIKMYRKYIHDASNLPVPISRGEMVSRKGENSIPSNNFI
jgi:hypothetical protein